jgi:hypothetical protein
MAVRRSGIQAVSMTLVRGRNCFLVKALMCCSTEAGCSAKDAERLFYQCKRSATTQRGLKLTK